MPTSNHKKVNTKPCQPGHLFAGHLLLPEQFFDYGLEHIHDDPVFSQQLCDEMPNGLQELIDPLKLSTTFMPLSTSSTGLFSTHTYSH